MRFLRGTVLVLSLPLLLAAAPLDAPPDPALRLTPAPDTAPPTPPAPDLPLRLPPPQPANAAPPPLPLSFGPQKIAFAGGVTATFDLVYASLRGFRPLTLDLYQPVSRGAALPLVVFVHGGGWNGGDTRHAASFEDFPRQLAALAAQGYVVASVNYRLSGETHFPAAVQDVKAAIRWLRGQARDDNIDVTRVAVWGDGAGGQLAALTGVTCGVPPFEPEANDKKDANASSDCVQAVIDWYGATDLETLAADNDTAPAPTNAFKPAPAGFQPPPASDEGDFLGCEPANCAPVLARLASPLAFLSATSPAFLIQHGAADASVSPKQSQKLYDALRKASAPAELVVYPDVGHNFTRDGFGDPATLQAAMQKLTGFLAAVFPATPLGPKIAQPASRGSLY